MNIFNSRISDSRKIPGSKNSELGGSTVLVLKNVQIRVQITLIAVPYTKVPKVGTICNNIV